MARYVSKLQLHNFVSNFEVFDSFIIFVLIDRMCFTLLLLEGQLSIQRGRKMLCTSVVQATPNGVFSVM